MARKIFHDQRGLTVRGSAAPARLRARPAQLRLCRSPADFPALRAVAAFCKPRRGVPEFRLGRAAPLRPQIRRPLGPGARRHRAAAVAHNRHITLAGVASAMPETAASRVRAQANSTEPHPSQRLSAPRGCRAALCERGRSRRYSCLVVVFERVVVVPPSRPVSCFVWLSVLPAIPSRRVSFSMPEFGAVVVPLEPGTAAGGFLSPGEDTAGGGARGIDGGGVGG